MHHTIWLKSEEGRERAAVGDKSDEAGGNNDGDSREKFPKTMMQSVSQSEYVHTSNE